MLTAVQQAVVMTAHAGNQRRQRRSVLASRAGIRRPRCSGKRFATSGTEPRPTHGMEPRVETSTVLAREQFLSRRSTQNVGDIVAAPEIVILGSSDDRAIPDRQFNRSNDFSCASCAIRRRSLHETSNDRSTPVSRPGDDRRSRFRNTDCRYRRPIGTNRRWSESTSIPRSRVHDYGRVDDYGCGRVHSAVNRRRFIPSVLRRRRCTGVGSLFTGCSVSGSADG